MSPPRHHHRDGQEKGKLPWSFHPSKGPSRQEPFSAGVCRRRQPSSFWESYHLYRDLRSPPFLYGRGEVDTGYNKRMVGGKLNPSYIYSLPHRSCRHQAIHHIFRYGRKGGYSHLQAQSPKLHSIDSHLWHYQIQDYRNL
eukprot:GHVS01090392.1.p1 GENE.GHVS01090392.1~~GHVS01090392.1.p1  ORF type:complete len:140 (+),score=9.24 GHVS01090392.1:243-662(+)